MFDFYISYSISIQVNSIRESLLTGTALLCWTALWVSPWVLRSMRKSLMTGDAYIVCDSFYKFIHWSSGYQSDKIISQRGYMCWYWCIQIDLLLIIFIQMMVKKFSIISILLPWPQGFQKLLFVGFNHIIT